MQETIYEILTDIREMEDAVLYYQHRIMQKRIAIEELMHSKQCRDDALATADLVEPRLTVKEMIEKVLPEVNGEVFGFPEIMMKCAKTFPRHEMRIRRSLYARCRQLVAEGALAKVPGGMTRSGHTGV